MCTRVWFGGHPCGERCSKAPSCQCYRPPMLVYYTISDIIPSHTLNKACRFPCLCFALPAPPSLDLGHNNKIHRRGRPPEPQGRRGLPVSLRAPREEIPTEDYIGPHSSGFMMSLSVLSWFAGRGGGGCSWFLFVGCLVSVGRGGALARVCCECPPCPVKRERVGMINSQRCREAANDFGLGAPWGQGKGIGTYAQVGRQGRGRERKRGKPKKPGDVMSAV